MESSRFQFFESELPDVEEDPLDRLEGPKYQSATAREIVLSEEGLVAGGIRKHPIEALERATMDLGDNRPMEKIHDLRREVKDELTAPPVAIGAVIAETVQKQPNYVRQSVQLAPSASSASADSGAAMVATRPTASMSRSLYTQAILAGFMLGVVFLILLVLFILVSVS